jgi:hypothetical protein
MNRFLFLLPLAVACGRTHAAEPRYVDAVAHCEAVERIECDRRLARDEIPESELAACKAEAPDLCAGETFPETCDPLPTIGDSNECLNLLRAAENLEVPIGAIPECELCP